MYKPPKVQTCSQTLSMLCDVILRETENVVIIGDLNCDTMSDNEVTDTLTTYDLQNLVTSPTCFKVVHGSSIDVCFVSRPTRFKKLINLDCWLSDHHNFICVSTKMHVPNMTPPIAHYRSYKKFCDEEYILDLNALNFNMMHSNGSLEDIMQNFHSDLTDIVNTHAPMKRKLIRNSQVPYMNGAWRKMNHLRNMMRNRKNRFPCKNNFENYRRLRNKCEKTRKLSQRMYFKERCDGGPKNQSFWKTVKPFLSTKCKNKNKIFLRENDCLVSDPIAVADIFNTYFVNIADGIGKDIDGKIPPDYENDESLINMISKYDSHPSILAIKRARQQCCPFQFSEVMYDDVYSLLVNLDPKKATGYDNIPSKLLKVGAFPLAGTLCKLINFSITECKFPDILKFAEVSAQYKKSDMLCKENYRPVSILAALSKVFEKVHCKQMTSYFNDIFSKFLSGFRKKYGCQSTLLRMVENWKSAIEAGELVGTVAIDLSKAFDSLPHSLLIAKLAAYGFHLSACKLIASYLHNRKQCVKIQGKRSAWSDVIKGVPQGSILGPLLFNIFINDIFLLDMSCSIYNYADDNCISYSHRNVDCIKSVLSDEITALMTWFKLNSLEANPNKFQSMLVSPNAPKDNDLQIEVSDNVITATSTMKILGMHIDSKLNFNGHIAFLCTKAGRQLNVLQRMRGSLDYVSKMAIYNSFIISNFNYCPVVWMFTSKSSLNKLENIQKRALRFVCNDFVSNYSELLEKCGSQGVKLMTLRCMAIEVYKCVNNMNPQYLNEMFTLKKCPYDLRDNSLLERPAARLTNYGLKSFKSYGAKIWNLLPATYKMGVSFDTFKNMIKTWSGPTCKCSVCCLFTTWLSNHIHV